MPKGNIVMMAATYNPVSAFSKLIELILKVSLFDVMLKFKQEQSNKLHYVGHRVCGRRLQRPFCAATYRRLTCRTGSQPIARCLRCSNQIEDNGDKRHRDEFNALGR